MKRLALILLAALMIALGLVGCSANGASEDDTIFADGSRGCEQAVGAVSLWDLPGGVPCGAKTIGEIPHGTRLTILERAARFGINYYLVEYAGRHGWIPQPLTKETEPLCQ